MGNICGYLSSVEPGLFFGLGKDTEVSKVEVFWPDGKTNVFENVSANREIIAKHSKAVIAKETANRKETLLTKSKASDFGVDYVHQENDFDEFQEEILLPHNISQNGPFTTVSDVNGDGLDDFFIGGGCRAIRSTLSSKTRWKF